MRLIDADKLIEEGYSLERTYRGNISSMVIEKREIKDIPVVDAVPVIRCKDCKHSEGHTELWCEVHEIRVDIDYFCAEGERRDER